MLSEIRHFDVLIGIDPTICLPYSIAERALVNYAGNADERARAGMEIKLPPRTRRGDRKFYDGCGPAMARSLVPGTAKLIRTGVLTSFVTHAGPREREMLFVPEARNAEITGVTRPLSHIGRTKWHDFLEAVLVIHRGRRETE